MRQERAGAWADEQPGTPDGVPLPDSVMPAQFFHLRDAGVQAEKRLMLAVLEDAVATIHRYRQRRTLRERRLLADVEDWFAAPVGEWPFGFERICEALGVDAGYIRSGLARWRQGAAPMPPRVAFRRLGGVRHLIGPGSPRCARQVG